MGDILLLQQHDFGGGGWRWEVWEIISDSILCSSNQRPAFGVSSVKFTSFYFSLWATSGSTRKHWPLEFSHELNLWYKGYETTGSSRHLLSFGGLEVGGSHAPLYLLIIQEQENEQIGPGKTLLPQVMTFYRISVVLHCTVLLLFLVHRLGEDSCQDSCRDQRTSLFKEKQKWFIWSDRNGNFSYFVFLKCIPL